MPGLEIHVLDCGQGDTILIQLHGSWALVDCHLPGPAERARFFAYLERLGVRRLDLVCLTHPHIDHFAGMQEVLEHFTSDGRTVGCFCDGGLQVPLITALLRARDGHVANYHARLYQRVRILYGEQRLEYLPAARNSLPLLVGGGGDQLVTIGPDPTPLHGKSLEELADADAPALDLNQFSLILHLEARLGEVAVDVLLAADTDGERLNAAVTHLATRRAKENKEEPAPIRLNVVKVAHHGSAASHRGSGVCGLRKTGNSNVAVISVGTKFPVLPDRRVISDFLDHGWRVLTTNKRVGRSPQTKAVAVSGVRRPASVDYTISSQDVIIRWEGDGFRWEPTSAEVSKAELSHYATARSYPSP